ncbi:hypothetical protein COY90_05160 [Candidatus Roizmanbacteria bacterium CG_4_10_14_0_8_um_filter_39_9]|uniref:Type II secretion system protein GspG C-terminal domain-containing protein n=1 Tax=Candidatus Roizmanbacteria bacterium CG_4_10_14_0_8_um_filter_39_9 TaxID=1974829 RepID=A0A2M7QCJ9_9BACT|nr:MAG: hypothetical protein COY90_05160 [Candidatus Roizmanbacteria bacterium CG_4_10_14_0_8_um_filter_39_9]
MDNKYGFTLVEILVVIAITIGLVAMIFPNFTNMRELARDNQRKSDLKQLQKMLEIYKESQSPISYPADGTIPSPCSSWSVGTTIITNKVPGDPRGTCTSPSAYYYRRTIGDTLRYVMYACLENKNDKEGIVDNPEGFGTCMSGIFYKVVEP